MVWAGLTAGVEIDAASDEMWVKIFVNLYDLIVERAGGVY